MKKFIFCLSAVLTVVLSGCAVCSQSGQCPDSAYTGKKIKVGYFVGDGSRSSGIFYWAQLLHYSPQLDVTLLDAQDIRDGKLKTLDLLLIPGGSSESQCRDLQEAGKKAVQEFVYNGGSYVGICAGFHCTLNRKERLELMPFEYCHGASGSAARLAIDISKRGAEVLNIKPGRYYVRYSLGPISKPGPAWKHGKAEILGVYKSTVSRAGKPAYNFFNAPAAIYGNYGKGKVVATSFHPESYEATHNIALGCIYSVTGVTPTPVFPKNVRRPLRVAYYTPTTIGKAPIQRMLELDKSPEIDLLFAAKKELDEGLLSHVDALVIPDAYDHKNASLAKSCRELFRKFMDRGGRIYVSGKEAAAFEKHVNLIEVPAGKSFVPAVLEK